MTTSDPKVEEIRARLAAATPGPWSAHCPGDDDPAVTASVFFAGKGYIAGGIFCEDAEFIANAPTDIDYLLTKLDEAEKISQSTQLAFLDMASQTVAAEERERTLIAGVKEALAVIQRDVDRLANLDPSELSVLLSRLLPSTPTEEGKQP